MQKLNCPPDKEEENILQEDKNNFPRNNLKIYVSNITQLKEKVIQDFIYIINKLECGIKLNLSRLLENISIISLDKMLKNFPSISNYNSLYEDTQNDQRFKDICNRLEFLNTSLSNVNDKLMSLKDSVDDLNDELQYAADEDIIEIFDHLHNN